MFETHRWHGEQASGRRWWARWPGLVAISTLLFVGASCSASTEAVDDAAEATTEVRRTTTPPETTVTTLPATTTSTTVVIDRDSVVGATKALVDENGDVFKDALKQIGLVESVDRFDFDAESNTVTVEIQTSYGPPGDFVDIHKPHSDNFAWDHVFSQAGDLVLWNDELSDGTEIPRDYIPSLHLLVDGYFSYRCDGPQIVDFIHKDAGRIQFDERCIE